ncbi:unnamed protein product, partial [Vitis vinifera]
MFQWYLNYFTTYKPPTTTYLLGCFASSLLASIHQSSFQPCTLVWRLVFPEEKLVFFSPRLWEIAWKHAERDSAHEGGVGVDDVSVEG